MRREIVIPRENWRESVESRGLVYPMTDGPDGKEIPYWYESAAYALTMPEVDAIEVATEALHKMCIEAARYLATGELGNLGLPEGVLPKVAESLDADPVSIYGRFDLSYGGEGTDIKMLEYNADTPTGLIEAAIAQWYWLQDTRPDRDQFNSIHERLVRAWAKAKTKTGLGNLHFAHLGAEESGEEIMTVSYLRDTAMEAGWLTWGLQVEDIGFDSANKQFVGLRGEPIEACFKLYPWENMLIEDFGKNAMTSQTQWIEPLWKSVLSNKALLVALHRLFPDSPYLLPAYLDGPNGMEAFVKKPLHGREGANVSITAPGISIDSPGEYGDEGFVWQKYVELPEFDGNHMVLGSWVIDGESAGIGIRESDSHVTNFFARFVPHYLDAPAATEETRESWLQPS